MISEGNFKGVKEGDKPRPLPVLFTHYGDDWIRGSEVVLLDLLKSLDKTIISPIVWCNSQIMADACRREGFITYRTEFHVALDYGSTKGSYRSIWRLIRECRKICRDHGVNVLHANSGAPLQWLVPAGCIARLPVLGHLHIDYLKRSRFVLLFHGATRLIGVSRQAIRGPLEDGVATRRTQIIYNGVDFSRLLRPAGHLRGSLNISEDALVIATAGSLIRRKGHDVLIKAFSRLLEAHPSAHLLVMGDGPERSALENLANALGVLSRIHFLGQVDDVASAYGAADIFALASRGDSFGLVLAEAGFIGLPTIATDVGGIPEVIIHEQTGLLVKPDDVEGLVSALNRLIEDPVLRARLGANASARIKVMFTLQRMAEEFSQVYSQLSKIAARDLGWKGLSLRALRPYLRLILRSVFPKPFSAVGRQPGTT